MVNLPVSGPMVGPSDYSWRNGSADIIEEKNGIHGTPQEYRQWRRWSDHLEKEQASTISQLPATYDEASSEASSVSDADLSTPSTSSKSSVNEAATMPQWYETEKNVTFAVKVAPKNKAGSGDGIPLSEIASSPAAWQRLLTSTIFAMRNDLPTEKGEVRTVNMGLGGKPEAGAGGMSVRSERATKQAGTVRWKVSVRQK
ncbi:hypothetical protein EJ06DRAFT_559318 [Trichodelitschia bisporula]|uniref:Uncharacterized protein n=1 Tax=Trichodelitschia bisporula TaxID=703511 RepID=A0A6G1HMI3_9PEZI|nr:hypothetical protein EJ06DRAFT_559318 [Trichodelitschia bisporula]